MAKRSIKADLTLVGSNEVPSKPPQATLRDEVRESLLSILRDSDASAAAKASAGRTLLEYFDDAQTVGATRRGADMSAAELDAAIAKLGD